MSSNSRHSKVYKRGANERCRQAWYNMHARCENPNSARYIHYGGRGIKVGPRWHRSNPDGFLNFFLDMNNPPDDKSLDRIDVNGNYEPDNCQWATKQTQAKSRRKMGSITSFTPREVAEHISKMNESDIILVVRYVIRKSK